jgi:hypothetical protein
VFHPRSRKTAAIPLVFNLPREEFEKRLNDLRSEMQKQIDWLRQEVIANYLELETSGRFPAMEKLEIIDFIRCRGAQVFSYAWTYDD